MVRRSSVDERHGGSRVSGQLVFTPAANYHGPASFTYTITDGSVSAVATVIGHGDPGQRRAGGSERQLHGGRRRHRSRSTFSATTGCRRRRSDHHARQRHGHHRRWSGGLRHERHGGSRVGPARVHAGGQLPRPGLVHLHDHRRHGLGGGDGLGHGHPGQRCAGRVE